MKTQKLILLSAVSAVLLAGLPQVALADAVVQDGEARGDRPAARGEARQEARREARQQEARQQGARQDARPQAPRQEARQQAPRQEARQQQARQEARQPAARQEARQNNRQQQAQTERRQEARQQQARQENRQQQARQEARQQAARQEARQDNRQQQARTERRQEARQQQARQDNRQQQARQDARQQAARQEARQDNRQQQARQADREQRARQQVREQQARRADQRQDQRQDARREVRQDARRWDAWQDRARRTVVVRDNRRIVRLPRQANYGLINGCPPGLARKFNGCVPPGQARRIERIRYDYPRYDYVWRTRGDWYDRSDRYDYRYRDGYVYRLNPQGSLLGYVPVLGGALSMGSAWPAQYAYEPAPTYYTSYYGLNDGYDYRYADGVVYGLNRNDGSIGQVSALLTGQDWSIGQRMPAGYDVYNVPYAYRTQYVDGPDRWYRYDDGYVYQVDPTTQLVQAVIQMLA